MTEAIRTRALPLALLVALLHVDIGADDAARHAGQSARTVTSSMPTMIGNREMQPLIEGPRRGVRLDARPGDGVAWWSDVQFGDGRIELDLSGRNAPGQSFVGVAFHGADAARYDAVYFRPFNFRAATDVGRSHAVQYVSHPEFTWNRLRAEHPGRYEAALAPAPDPDGWFHARLEIAHPTVRVFVNDNADAVLEVRQLSDRKSGWVGVWVGNGSDGAFANLVVTPAAR